MFLTKSLSADAATIDTHPPYLNHGAQVYHQRSQETNVPWMGKYRINFTELGLVVKDRFFSRAESGEGA